MRKIIFGIVFLLGLAGQGLADKGQRAPEAPALLIFYSPGCHKCIEVKSEVMPQIEKIYSGKITIEYRDISEIENYKSLLGLQEKYAVKMENTWPVFYFQGQFLNGSGEVKDNLINLIQANLAKAYSGQRIDSSHVDLLSRFKSFRPLAIVSAGLIDGINPCAFTVIVFFISFLALQGYRKKELAVIGLSFILAVFLTYVLIGLGLFGFLYRLSSFWVVTKIINYAVGIFSIILGILCLYDFFKFKRTKEAEGLLLQLPQAVKNRIHAVIGMHYRASKSGQTQIFKKHIFRLIFSAFITGFLVSILEAVCTGQVYLPTITFVLKTTPLKIQALGYLLLYNLMFTVPLFIIFLFALCGVTSGQFAQFLKRHLLLIKILMAGLFFILGVFLFSGCAAQKTQLLPLKKIEVEQPRQEDPYSWNFGSVQAGSILEHEFILKNQTQQPLNIKETNTSCGCTVSRIEKKVLSPGESTVIKVRLDTKGYKGPLQQYVYVHTDNLDNPILRYIIKVEAVD